MRFRFALLGAVTCSLAGCPSTEDCPEPQIWNGTFCVEPYDGGTDTSGFDSGRAPDVPCGGCTSGVCDIASGDCVPCLDGDASTCTEDGDNACVGNTCVACDSNDDCTSLDAPECSSANECVSCTDDEACVGRAGTLACHDGSCAECSAGNATACTAGVCNLLDGTCTTTPARSGNPCRDCVNDLQCAVGQLCVPTDFPVGSGTVIGHHCAWREDATEDGGPMGACSQVPPYIRGAMATSINGVTARVCTPRVASCDALQDFSGVSCSPPGTTPNPMCGATDVDDGFCRMLDAGTNRCTVGCTSNDDCPCNDGTCARQYRCNAGFCEFDCTCAVGSSSCTLTSSGGACP